MDNPLWCYSNSPTYCLCNWGVLKGRGLQGREAVEYWQGDASLPTASEHPPAPRTLATKHSGTESFI